MTDTTYTEKDIQVLTDREHVRLRTAVYFGNMSHEAFVMPVFGENVIDLQHISFIPSVFKGLTEVIDNSCDEFSQINTKNKTLIIKASPSEGKYSIEDNGRGVPIGIHSEGQYTPQIVFGSLRSGRNFKDGKAAGTIGCNGVGSSCTCFTSSEFHVEIHREGRRYTQSFLNGAEKITSPIIENTYDPKKSGTKISFTLDNAVFKDVSLPDVLVRNRALEIALTNPKTRVIYNDEEFYYEKGFEEYVDKLSKSYFKFNSSIGEIYLISNMSQSSEEQFYSWVNSNFLFGGGSINTQFINAFTSKVVDHLSKEAKKLKCEVTKNDVRPGLFLLGNFKISDPQYDSQSKTRLTGPVLRKEVTECIDTQWKSFVKSNKEWLQNVLDRAVLRCKQENNKKAVKSLQKASSKKIPGLLDATSRIRSECNLMITEGLSACSQACEVRNPKTLGSYPLTGKINNVYGSSIAECLQMGKLTDLLAAIGLVPGEKAIRSNLRYSKIIIASDADMDGSSIMALLVNLFYQFWPELFDPNYEPFIHRLIAPNIVVSKNKDRKHFTSRAAYEQHKDKYKGWTVEYMKGLGSLHKVDWKLMMDNLDDFLLPFQDDGKLKETLTLIFGPDTDNRKKWLTNE